MFLTKLNPVEPPWYVTRMPGGVGGEAPRGVPLSQSIRFTEWPGTTGALVRSEALKIGCIALLRPHPPARMRVV